MAKANKTAKKENSMAGGIIMAVCGLLALLMGENYVWVLFGAIEIPLQIVGAVGMVLGVILTITGIKEKKAAQAKQETQQ